MYIEINTVGVLGKALNIKREKGEDDMEIVVAHLKFSDAIVPRETIDELLGRSIGWAQSSLFDEFGAPIARIDLGLLKFACEVTGKITGTNKGDSITLKQATLDGVVLTLHDKGASMAGNLAWLVAGDEASDAEPLIGRLCSLNWVLQDAGQKDLLKDVLDAASKLKKSMADAGGGSLSMTNPDGSKRVILEVAGTGNGIAA